MESEENSMELPAIEYRGFSERWGIPLLMLLAVLATLPGWLPRTVYVATNGIDRNNLQSQIISQTTIAAQQLRKGQWPLWNPSAGLGQPLLERGMVGVFAPTILPHLLLKPTWTWTISTVLRLAIGGIGFWLLARRYRLRNFSRFIAAALFMLGTLNIAHSNESLLNLISWLPWAVLASERIIERMSMWRIVIASLVFAGQFLTGDPAASICLLATTAAAMFLNVVWLQPRRGLMAMPALLLAIVLGAGLAAVQWIPLFDYGIRKGWPMPMGDSPRTAMLWMWSLPVWMMISLLIGYAGRFFSGCAECTPLSSDEDREPSARPLKKPLVPRIAVIATLALLGMSIGLHRGVSLTEFDAARREWNQNDSRPLTGSPAELPMAWGVAKTEWLTRQTDIATKLAASAFDATSTVLLTEEVSPDTAEWLNRLFPDRHAGKAEARSFWSAVPKVESAEQSGNQIRVRVKSGGEGWIVLNRAFADGWIAHMRPTGQMGTWAIRRQQIVLPADGKLMAVPVSVSMPVEIVFDYWPTSIRRGWLLSAGTGVVVILLLGIGISCKV